MEHIKADCMLIIQLINGSEVAFVYIEDTFMVNVRHFLQKLSQDPSNVSHHEFANRLQTFQLLCAIYAEKKKKKIFAYDNPYTPTDKDVQEFFRKHHYHECVAVVRAMEISICSKLVNPMIGMIKFSKELSRLPLSIWLSSLKYLFAPRPLILNNQAPRPQHRHITNICPQEREKILEELIAQEEEEKLKNQCQLDAMTKKKKKKMKKKAEHKTKSEPIIVTCVCTEEQKIHVSKSNFFCQCPGFEIGQD